MGVALPVDEGLVDGGVGVIEVVVEHGKGAGVEADGRHTNGAEAVDNGGAAAGHFGFGAFELGAANFDGLRGWCQEGAEAFFGGLGSLFHLVLGAVREADEKAFVHDVGFFGEGVDENHIIVHQDIQKHIVLIAADGGEFFEIGADVDFLAADGDLDIEGEGVQEALVGIFDAILLVGAHEVKVDALSGDDGTERAVFHDDEAIADFGNQEGFLGGVAGLGFGRGISGGDAGRLADWSGAGRGCRSGRWCGLRYGLRRRNR